MTKLLRRAVTNLLLFVLATLSYATFLVLLSPEGGRLEALREFLRLVFTLEVFGFPRFIGALSLFGGIPPLITWWASGRLSNKLNFILLPFAILAAMIVVVPIIYGAVFSIDKVGSALERILNFFAITGLIFQIGVCFIAATIRLLERRGRATTTS